MGRKAGVDREAVIEVAIAIVETDGLGALSLGQVAKRLGVKTPSLYHHVAGIDGLRREVALHAAAMLHERLSLASVGLGSVVGLADAQRAFAANHPGLYDSLLPAPTPSDDPVLAEVMFESVLVVRRVFEDQGLEASTEAIRAFRSGVHGFVMLERLGGFGLGGDMDGSFSVMVKALITGLQAIRSAGETR